MGQTTIEWTATVGPDGTIYPGYSFNPWVGCTKVSPACDHCYAESWAKRTGQPDLWTEGHRRRTSATNWQQPLRWAAKAAADGVRKRVFCASLADVFDNQVPQRWRDDLWHRIEQTPSLDWLLLTKRPQNIAKMLPNPDTGVKPWGSGWPNVWLGTTTEDQKRFDLNWHHLRQIPAKIHFISCEPALGPITFDGWKPYYPDWVICGGESGSKARPMHPDWARSLRNQCRAAGVPFFFKQWGEWHWLGQYAKGTPLGVDTPMAMIMAPSTFPEGVPDNPICMSRRGGKQRSGRILDGREWNEMPA